MNASIHAEATHRSYARLLCDAAAPWAPVTPPSRLAGAEVAMSAARHPLPAFSVEDLNGTTHTQRDLAGRWTVILAMTDKDCSAAIAACRGLRCEIC